MVLQNLCVAMSCSPLHSACIHLLALLCWVQNVPFLIWLLLTWGPVLQWNVWFLLLGFPGWAQQQALPEVEHGLGNLHHMEFYRAVSFSLSADGALCWGEESCHILHPAQWSVSCAILVAPQNSLILHFGQWSISLWEGLLQRVETTRNLQWRLSVGKHLLVSGSWPKTLNPFIISLGKTGQKTALKYLKNTKWKGFLLKFLPGVRQGHIKPWIYICKDPIISGL